MKDMNITQEQLDLEKEIELQESMEATEKDLEVFDWADEMTTDVKACSIEDDECEACGS